MAASWRTTGRRGRDRICALFGAPALPAFTVPAAIPAIVDPSDARRRRRWRRRSAPPPPWLSAVGLIDGDDEAAGPPSARTPALAKLHRSFRSELSVAFCARKRALHSFWTRPRPQLSASPACQQLHLGSSSTVALATSGPSQTKPLPDVKAASGSASLQPFDFTTLAAIVHELESEWVPARVDSVFQQDPCTLKICLRTLERREWLTVCWHPQACHMAVGAPPPRVPDSFVLSENLRHQLTGLALTAVRLPRAFERLAELQFAPRPGEPPVFSLYAELGGPRANVALVNAAGLVVTCAEQVRPSRGAARTLATGEPYRPPPAQLAQAPSEQEGAARWRERLALVPGPLCGRLVREYKGVSPALARAMAERAGLDPQAATDGLADADWAALWDRAWLPWLAALASNQFRPAPLPPAGYCVLGWRGAAGAGGGRGGASAVVSAHYGGFSEGQAFARARAQLEQRVRAGLARVRGRLQALDARRAECADADGLRREADELMAAAWRWQRGEALVQVEDFDTGELRGAPVDPQEGPVPRAQALYRRHGKLRRAEAHLAPLAAAAEGELEYLLSVEAALDALAEEGAGPAAEAALREVRDELLEQGLLRPGRGPPGPAPPPARPGRGGAKKGAARGPDPGPGVRRVGSPGGLEVLAGRNNRQNEALTFRLASDADLWLHAQGVPGAHVLLRGALAGGAGPPEADLQLAADVAAHLSRARGSARVPVAVARRKDLSRPKGGRPGMVLVNRTERVLWGRPDAGAAALAAAEAAAAASPPPRRRQAAPAAS